MTGEILRIRGGRHDSFQKATTPSLIPLLPGDLTGIWGDPWGPDLLFFRRETAAAPERDGMAGRSSVSKIDEGSHYPETPLRSLHPKVHRGGQHL